MDCRDITEKTPIVNNDCLVQIFELQKELIDHYVKIEGLPPYPLNLDLKQNQLLIKDFSARIVEELGECFESYIMMEKVMFNENGPDQDVAINHLQNLNEELSDALHFYIELLIFSGIDNSGIFDYINNNKQNQRYSLFYDGMVTKKNTIGMGLYLMESPTPYYNCGTWIISDKDLKDEFLRGGRYLGTIGYKERFKVLLWDITYNLQMARNALKNKPWKQTQMLTDKFTYRQFLCETFMSFCRLFVFLGMTEESIMEIYFKKNRINKFRIVSKY